MIDPAARVGGVEARETPLSAWTSLRLWLGTAFVFFLAGCAIGPNYHRPGIESPDHFRSAPDTVSTNSLAEVGWWEVYQDQSLQGLIRNALTNNYDLRLAVARVEQARAISIQARSQFLPQINYQGIAA